MQRQTLPQISEIDFNSLKEGDKLYTVEFSKDGDSEGVLETRELTFVRFHDSNNHIEGLDEKEGAILAELKDERFDKVELKTDISTGFFLTEKEACWSFVDSLREVYEEVKAAYEKKFS